jgi:CRISPR-associated protein Cmr3
MTIEIEALDTLIFQDGKPFDKSGDNWGNSLVLPTPSTLYGALRATYFANHIDVLSKANEDDDPTKNLKINFIGLKYQEKLIFAMPKDCVESKREVKTLDLEENLLTNSPLKYTLFSKDEVESIDKGYLKNSNLKKYLSNKTIGSFEMEDSLMIRESKIGIGLNRKTKTTGEGLLYRVEMLHYKDLKIVVGFDGLYLEESGLMKLGGEAKGAKYQQFDSLDISQIDNISSNIFKLYLLTPAIFDNGWYPDWIDKENDFTGEYKGFKLKLVASAIGKHQSIGGFDIKKREPKKMMKAVPMGSVYYIEILEGDRDKVVETFNLSLISDYKQEEGYGLVMIGDVK